MGEGGGTNTSVAAIRNRHLNIVFCYTKNILPHTILIFEAKYIIAVAYSQFSYIFINQEQVLIKEKCLYKS